ncbi:berberine bridge enzyme-like 23 [Papaver somniferum]|uniref:berberine bridge enzyme-like 23 n=1 Tax=Papaver somniferum TaxID=3469 RepID=UPI000E6FD480|nr:berberine bridge enzyme-like 23 [Papaver somniferum]
MFVLFLISWIAKTTSSTTSSSSDITQINSFLECMSLNSYPSSQIHSQNASSYSTLLSSFRITVGFTNSTTTVKPLIILTPNNESDIKTVKPLIILTPNNESDIKTTLNCSVINNLQIRVRSGGHDYEGLSWKSDFRFIIVDLVNIRSISVDVKKKSAWIQAGVTLDEVYYSIAEKRKTLGFPARTCPTMGVGGHFSGGGIGVLVRKYGLAADISSMGENLFWAIRGGSGASFGIILSWKIKLVSVPPIITSFTPSRSLSDGAIKLFLRWQEIADKFHEDLYVRVVIQNGFDQTTREKTVSVLFNSLYLGGVEELLNLMGKSFPELGLKASDCTEMSRIQSITPISEIWLQGLWTRVLQEDIVYIIMDPLGGMMSNISEFEISFPRRKGNLYNIQYIVQWSKQKRIQTSQQHLDWIRDLYKYMTPYVSNSPRVAYLNYRDLDLGKNDSSNINYTLSIQWGMKYFKGNFQRLALIKKEIDPQNFFRNEQSTPQLSY